MNKETIELIKGSVVDRLESNKGLGQDAYDLLVKLMCLNRDLAQDMHSLIETVVKKDNRYYFDTEYGTDVDHGYEL